VPLCSDGKPHQLRGVADVVSVTALGREIQHHCGCHGDRRILDLVVGALGRDREPLLEVLDGRNRLVVVLQLLLKVAQRRLVVLGITDLYRPAGEVGHGRNATLHGAQ